MALKVPSLFDKESVHDFFLEFLELNSSNRGFSQRSFSQKIKWPVSYLPDLIKKRKAFTVKRAIEFGNHLGLSPIDVEKLIYWAILDSGLAKQVDVDKVISTKSIVRKQASEDTEVLSMFVFLVFECIRWLHGKATEELLEEILFKKGIEKSQVISSIQLLRKKNFIKKQGNKLTALKPSLFSDDFGGIIGNQLHEQFMNLQAEYFKAPIGPAIFNSAIVHIERSRFEEIADRIVAFRNWLLEISLTDSVRPMKDDVRLFQLDLNLTSLFDKKLVEKLRAK